MANRTPTGAQKLLREADELIARAAAKKAYALALQSVEAPDGIVGALDAIDRCSGELERALRLEPSKETVQVLADVLADFSRLGRDLDKRAKKMRAKVAKFGNGGTAKARSGKQGSGRQLPPPPDDLSVLDDDNSALEAYLEASGYAETSATKIRASWQRLVAVAHDHGVAPASLDPQQVLSDTYAAAASRMVRWINASRASADQSPTEEAPAAEDHDGSDVQQVADTSEPPAEGATDDEPQGAASEPLESSPDQAPETPGDPMNGLDGEEDGAGQEPSEHEDASATGNERRASMDAVLQNPDVEPTVKVAVSAVLAGLSPTEVVGLRHEDARMADDLAHFTTESGKSFQIGADLYAQLVDQTGHQSGNTMVDSEGVPLTARVLAQMVGQAVTAADSH